MSITGAKFLELNGINSIIVTDHALNRFNKCTGSSYDHRLASAIFKRAVQVKYEHLLKLGYRPSYHKRREKGISSWYFVTTMSNQELIIVVSNGKFDNSMVWITTMSLNEQSKHFRIIDKLKMGE